MSLAKDYAAAVAAMTDSDRVRFESKIIRTDGCHHWIGTLNTNGYGVFMLRKHHRYYFTAHRLALVMAGVAMRPEDHTDHLCRNPPCVNPDHLEAVSPRVNTIRGLSPHGKNANKTHCVHGHELSGFNLIINSAGRRVCRACMRDSLHRRYHKDVPTSRALARAWQQAKRDRLKEAS